MCSSWEDYRREEKEERERVRREGEGPGGLEKGRRRREEEEKKERREQEKDEKEEEENEEGRHTTTETVVGGLPPSLELQCTLILLLTVQSTMSLRMAGRILEKFLYTSTRHPSLGRGNSVKNRHYHVL